MAANANESAIRFYSETYAQRCATTAAGCLVVQIPATVRSKTALLQLISQQLKFPVYFGWNWDALSDCLRDLHWLDEVKRVRIIHEAVPFLPGWKKRGIYLNLLQEVVLSWNANPGIQIEALFPTSTQAEVQGLVG
jgi:hypothetical protein